MLCPILDISEKLLKHDEFQRGPLRYVAVHMRDQKCSEKIKKRFTIRRVTHVWAYGHWDEFTDGYETYIFTDNPMLLFLENEITMLHGLRHGGISVDLQLL